MDVKTISEQLFFTTIKIECSSTQYSSTGTGFFVIYEKEDKQYIFIVTNKHVVEDSTIGKFTFTKSNNEGYVILGDIHTVTINDFNKVWTYSDDNKIDIAICPVGQIFNLLKEQNIKIFFRGITNNLFLTKDHLKEIDAFEDIIFIGYPNGLWDSKNYLPIMRKGITATPIAVDFELEKKFLIDASVFPGSSGSPIFIINKGSFPKKDGSGLFFDDRLIFLGILSAAMFKTDIKQLEILPINTLGIKTNEMIDIGIVFKAELIFNIIEKHLKNKKLIL